MKMSKRYAESAKLVDKTKEYEAKLTTLVKKL